MNDAPAPPKGAVMRFADGREVPVRLLYVGTDEQGRSCWRGLVQHVDGIEDADLFFDDDPSGHIVDIDFISRDL